MNINHSYCDNFLFEKKKKVTATGTSDCYGLFLKMISLSYFCALADI